VAVAPFTRIVVDKKEEAKFRRRALRRFPLEYIEALWGQIRGDILYICAFVRMEVDKATIKSLYYDEQELDFHVEDAKEAGLQFLGTIHSHPNCEDTRFGDTDLENVQDSGEIVMGIAAIQRIGEGRKKRKRCILEYWPVVHPLITIRMDSDASSTIKKGRKPVRKASRKRR
jgi:proteasome lid subunit RPN8/RPN11